MPLNFNLFNAGKKINSVQYFTSTTITSPLITNLYYIYILLHNTYNEYGVFSMYTLRTSIRSNEIRTSTNYDVPIFKCE